MAVINSNENWGAPENLKCIECNASVYGDDGKVILSGGYHGGDLDLFLCSHCARDSDLRKIGYIIGDAIVSDYNADWGFVTNEVDKIMGRLKASVLRAIVHKQQLKLRKK